MQQSALADPHHEKELFASEVAHVAFVHGNFIITLASLRMDEPVQGQPLNFRRVVSGRVALTNVAASQLLAQLQGLAKKIEAAAAAAKEKLN
jgi:hypothetical protein